MVGSITDIHERKQAEKALRESEARARAILETTVDGIITIDDEGCIESFNPAAEQTFGYQAEEVIGRNVKMLMPSPYHEEHDGYLGNYLETGHPKIIGIGREVVGRRKDGSTFPMDLAISEVKLDNQRIFTGIVRDITERKRAKEEIRASHEKIEAILNSTVDAIITISQQGRIESSNLAAEKIFGYKAEEMIGQNVKILMPSPYREEHDDYLRNYLKTGHRKIIGIGREIIGQRKDGSIFPMELAISEVKLGRRHFFTGIVRDISERRHLEQEILRISEHERMRIGQDLHDGLGSQLTGIGLITKSLARKLEISGLIEVANEVAEIAELIKEADYQARNIARGLVPVAPEPDGLRRALDRLAANAGRLFDISCIFEEESEVFLADNATATHLYRIAQEAVSNAVKHGQASHVTIHLVESSAPEGIEMRVEDNGIGFPDEMPEERGIGLRTMQYRAHLLRATLSFERALEGGTVVACKIHPMESVQV